MIPGRLLLATFALCWLLTACVAAKPPKAAPSPSPRPPVRPKAVPSPSPTPNPLLQLTDPANPPGAARPGEPGALTMQQSVDTGLKQNPQVRVADEKVKMAIARYELSETQLNPKFLFTDQTYIRPQGGVSIPTPPILGNQQDPTFPAVFNIIDTVQSSIGLSLQKLLTTFGRVENEISAAFLNIDAQAKLADVTRRSVILSVKQGFLQQLKALAGQDAARLNLLVTEQSLADTNAQFNQGLLAKYDVVQAELQVVEATQQLQQRTTDIGTTAATFRTVVVLPQDAPVRLIPPPAITVDPDVTLKSLETLAVVNRPEMQALERELAVADALLKSAESDNNPVVSMGLHYMTNPGNSLAASNLVLVGLNVQWYLYDGGQRDAKVDEAEARIRGIQAQGEQIKLQVLLDVQNAWLNYLQTKFNVDTAVKRVETASVYYDMARQRFKVGLATSLEVQQAIQALNDARVNLVQANYDRDLAFAQLEQALGTDFPDRHVTLASLTPPPPTPPPGEDDEKK